jgi:tryptophanyl-tRNA synthetase
LRTGDQGKKSGESGSRAPALQKARVLSGMRPTGRMHIGNYFGALQNWVRLQNETLPVSEGAGLKPGATQSAPKGRAGSPLATRHSPLPAYECFYFIADWHSLTSDYADTSGIAQNVIEIATDYLAGGLDPKKCVIFQQSLIPEHAELHLLLSMVTPLGWLERVPTYKEALENIKDKDLHNYGFLGYPVLQCGDIVMYGEPGAHLYVPVGEDQVSHVEISREIVRRFNLFNGLRVDERLRQKDPHERTRVGRIAGVLRDHALNLGPEMFPLNEDRWREWCSRLKSRILEVGYDNAVHLLNAAQMPADLFMIKPTLTEPEAMLTQTPKIPGLDGRKMSKSYGNTIMLSESDGDIRAKTKVMVTDPARRRRTDPGNPDVCPVYDWHKLFSAEEPGRLEWVRKGCTTAGIGCIECKEAMANNLIKWITPIRERRVEYEKHPKRVLEVIEDGSKKARKVAQGTMERVREAVFGWEKKRKEIDGTAGSAKA